MTRSPRDVRVEARAEAHGRRRLVLLDAADMPLTELTLDPVTMHDGSGGVVQLAGIGNVATPPAHRRRGYAARLLEVAMGQVREQGLAGSLLYGIDGFYDRLGWRSCGDERWTCVPTSDPDGGRPPGEWRVRSAREQDRDALARCYARLAPSIPGALERPSRGRAWSSLDVADVAVVELEADIVGWAWRGAGAVPERDARARVVGHEAVFAELQARDEAAMAMVCVAARSMLTGADAGVEALEAGAPELHPLRRLARRRGWKVMDEHRPTGGPMLRLFAERHDLQRGDLYQFLPDRF